MSIATTSVLLVLFVTDAFVCLLDFANVSSRIDRDRPAIGPWPRLHYIAYSRSKSCQAAAMDILRDLASLVLGPLTLFTPAGIGPGRAALTILTLLAEKVANVF